MERARTVATFVAGVLVGGSAVYFSPPDPSSTTGPPGAGAPLLPPLPEGQNPALNGTPPTPIPGTDATTAGVPAPTPGTIVPPTGAATATPGVVPMPDPSLPPPDAAEGPPPDEVPAAPPGAVQQAGSRLEKHLRIATSIWEAQAEAARASAKAPVRALAGDIAAHAQNVPTIGEHMPPMQEVAGYLAASRLLLDRMAAAGMDVADLSLQVDMMMRPPKGKIPGGPKPGATPP